MEAKARVPVAQYMRMSTDDQQYSIAIQEAAIQKYSESHGFVVVSTYVDAGRSGVAIKHRPELLRLIHDVTSGDAKYNAILVYDVSRWGRFQDVDEAAHYEFLCKTAGVPVRYCAEQFDNDGSLPSSMMKALKRTMAAEYSRELGVKVSAGQRRIALLGFRVAGVAGYGLRRMTVSPDGRRKIVLKAGERKAIKTDRAILVLGPQREVECMRTMFRLAAGRTKRSVEEIAVELNRRHMLRSGRRLWDRGSVYRMLTNHKYAGCNVYGKTTRSLGSPQKRIERKLWITKSEAFAPIVTLAEFNRAQAFVHRRAEFRKRSNAYILRAMKSVLARHGKITQKLLKQKGIFDYRTHYQRFGSISTAYELAGYPMSPVTLKTMKTQQQTKLLRNDLHARLKNLFFDRIRFVASPGQCRKMVEIDGAIRVGILLCRQAKATSAGECSYGLCAGSREKDFPALICTMNRACSKLLDFHLFPPLGPNFLKRRFFRKSHPWFSVGRRLATLAHFCIVAKEIAARQDNTEHYLAVDDILVSLDNWKIVLGKKEIALGPITFTMFRLLLRNAGRVVTPAQLSRCFPGKILKTEDVRVHICWLRKKLGTRARRRIKKIPGVGWRVPSVGYMYASPGTSR